MSKPPQLVLENIGPIKHADITFGDLTVLVGPQATGKSLFLQFLKLAIDHQSILTTLREHGADWGGDAKKLLEVYLGRGMSSVWRGGSSRSWIRWEGEDLGLDAVAAGRKAGDSATKCFMVPAQRVLAYSTQSWIRPFGDFVSGDPFVLRQFSEVVRRQLDDSRGNWLLDDESERLIEESLFARFQLGIQTTGTQRELVLTGGRRALPFMVWSAGQREFVPLFLALLWLLPAKPRARKCDWVIIEEPEMGLHPKAIATVLFLVLQLMHRGYRVCLSTHSTHVLDLVWALQIFTKTDAAPRTVLDVFEAEPTRANLALGRSALSQSKAVYYFDESTQIVKNISVLDPGDADEAIQTWGRLMEFSGHIGELVARQVASHAR